MNPYPRNPIWPSTVPVATVQKTSGTLILCAVLATGIFIDNSDADMMPWRPDTPLQNLNVFDWSLYGGLSTNFVVHARIVNEASGLPATSETHWSIWCVIDSIYGQIPVGLIEGSGETGSAFFGSPPQVPISDAFAGTSLGIGSVSKAAVDVKQDGWYGNIDPSTGLFIPDGGSSNTGEWSDMMSGFSWAVEGTNLNLTATYWDWEKATSLGILTLWTCRQTGEATHIGLSLNVTPIGSTFYVQVCTNLTQKTWINVVPNGCIATGVVTSVVMTNNTPTAFYRVSSEPASP